MNSGLPDFGRRCFCPEVTKSRKCAGIRDVRRAALVCACRQEGDGDQVIYRKREVRMEVIRRSPNSPHPSR